MVLTLVLACSSPPPTLSVRRVQGGLEVVADRPLSHVRVTAPGVDTTVDPRGGERVFVPVELPRGERVAAAALGVVATVDVPPIPADVLLELPTGAPGVLLGPGDVVARSGDPAASATLRVVSAGTDLGAEPDGLIRVVHVGRRVVALGPPGTTQRLTLPSTVEDLPIEGGGGAFTVSWRLDAGEPVEVTGVDFPAGADGAADPARAPGVVVPPPLAGDAPWGFVAVGLHNPAAGAATVSVALELPGPAFAPRLPGGGAVARAVVTVPAGGDARAALPVFVDPALARPGPVEARVVVTDAATGAALAATPLTWRVATTDRAVAAFAASLPLSVGGLLLLGFGGPVFLRRTPVHELTLVACLGAVTFVVGAAFQLVGYGVAVALGPFAPFVTALFDDLFRVALLAALVTRVPRPGVASAAALTGFLMRGLALGGLHPGDLLYLGNQVVLVEANLWLAGLTRSPAWKAQGRWARTARLAAGFAPAQAASVALGLVTTSALYRLYWDPAWALAMVLLPGGAYVALAAALSAPLADELDRVAE